MVVVKPKISLYSIVLAAKSLLICTWLMCLLFTRNTDQAISTKTSPGFTYYRITIDLDWYISEMIHKSFVICLELFG